MNGTCVKKENCSFNGDEKDFYILMLRLMEKLGFIGSTGRSVNGNYSNGKNGIVCENMNKKLSSKDESRLHPVIDFRQPSELQKEVDLCLDEDGTSRSHLEAVCEAVVSLSVRTGDFRFRNQLFGAVDHYGLAASLMLECMNTSAYTYEVAPVFSLCEHEVLQCLCRLVGWSKHEGDGIFTPGGSIANMCALVLARYSRYPEIKQKGINDVNPAIDEIYTSEEAHYSIVKAAHWMGLGTDNVVKVRCDEFGQMKVECVLEELELAEDSGKSGPRVIVATAGTTVQGAFDPLLELADICESRGIWLHVDAAWGGAVLFSEKHSHLLTGLSRADSITWNPHKMLGAPLQCSVLLVRHKGLLKQCNSAHATYLFQADKPYDVSLDSGDASIQCGRKADAFKLWLMWKARGRRGLGALVDRTIEIAHTCGAMVEHRVGFRLVNRSRPVQCANVCFWFVPTCLRDQREDERWWAMLGKVAPQVKKRMLQQGSLMVGYQPLQRNRRPNFFRLVFTCHPQLEKHHVSHLLDQIERLAEEINLADLQ